MIARGSRWFQKTRPKLESWASCPLPNLWCQRTLLAPLGSFPSNGFHSSSIRRIGVGEAFSLAKKATDRVWEKRKAAEQATKAMRGDEVDLGEEEEGQRAEVSEEEVYVWEQTFTSKKDLKAIIDGIVANQSGGQDFSDLHTKFKVSLH